MGNFVQNTTNKHPMYAHEGKLVSFFCKFKSDLYIL